MSSRYPLRRAAGRLRLLAVLAGLAWLMGVHPGVPVRLLVVAVVVDALADTNTGTSTGPRLYRPRPRRWGGARR